jgi:hypothetical protein
MSDRYIEKLERELQKAEEKNQRLQKLIDEHNSSCVGACDTSRNNGHCNDYVIRQRQCPDCPRDWMTEEGEV